LVPYKRDDEVKGAHTGRQRARKLFPVLGMCEKCENKPAFERHHLDGNQLNNHPQNVARLCRHCHMIEDGRLVLLTLRNAGGLNRKQRNQNPCSVCGTDWFPLRKGRCAKCSEYFRNHGVERPKDLPPPNADIAGGSPCRICHRLYKPLRKGRCAACAVYLRKHGVERVAAA